jgi:acetate kinase
VFTAGVGENSPYLRERACAGLDILGLSLDRDKNAAACGVEADIATSASGSRILVVPTNEEKLIAQDTYALAQS